jgi:RimJ/RimL family protein N-acetyltransferase
MKPIIMNITDNFNDYKDKIELFTKNLDAEIEYFPMIDRSIRNSKLIFIAINEKAEIVGVAGSDKTRYFFRTYILIQKEYQGKGIGKDIYNELLTELKRHQIKIILAVINKGNIRSLKMHIKLGYKFVGIRWDLYYLFKPLSIKGRISFHLIKVIFPFVVIVDSLYENIYLPKKIIKNL